MVVVQAWKEMVLGILCLLALPGFFRQPQRLLTRWNIFAVLLLVLGCGYLLFAQTITQAVLGFRTLALPWVMYVVVQYLPVASAELRILLRTLTVMVLIVCGFGLLQYLVLPADFLRHFGYSAVVNTWLPGGNIPMYQTVGESGWLRVQSTFAGPNQLASWLLVVLPLVWWFGMRVAAVAWRRAAYVACALGALTLILTFSRGGALGLLVIAGIYAAGELWRKFGMRGIAVGLSFVVGMLVVFSVAVATLPQLRDTLVRTGSTSAHLIHLQDAGVLALQHPFGLGLGTTAGVSQRFDEAEHVGITPENTFLAITLELGYVGGVLFVLALGMLLQALVRVRAAAAYSVLGIFCMLLVLHPLDDAPTALYFGLLAGLGVSQVAATGWVRRK